MHRMCSARRAQGCCASGMGTAPLIRRKTASDLVAEDKAYYVCDADALATSAAQRADALAVLGLRHK